MKTPLSIKSIALAAALLAAPFTASAVDASLLSDISKAGVIMGKVSQIMDKYREMTIELEAPEPRYDTKGKYLLPYLSNGEPTEWASKALNAQAGKIVGEKVADKAVGALASKVPFGGLAGGFMRKKAKESAAVIALGGKKFIEETSDQSLKSADDYCVFMHVRHGSDPDYKIMLASAVALYPDLEKRMPSAIQKAYKAQARRKK
jgi:hypothetical protein